MSQTSEYTVEVTEAKTPTDMHVSTAPPDSVEVDESFDFIGYLSPADEPGVGLEGKTIELVVNGSVEDTMQTDENGSWGWEITPTSEGTYTVKARFPGDADYEGC